MSVHLTIVVAEYGKIPLCGRAYWDGLTEDPDECTCWECKSIAGTESFCPTCEDPIDYCPGHGELG